MTGKPARVSKNAHRDQNGLEMLIYVVLAKARTHG
jgi:hypothetical protein